MNALACTNCQMLLAPGARFCSHCGTVAPTPPAINLPREASGTLRRGVILQERYKIMTFIGAGGFSRVYGAIDLRLKTPCAIKENNEFDQSAHAQFLAEAQLLARLRHPSMTKVTDYFTDPSGAQFLVMEYAPGKDLEKMMDEAEEMVSWRKVAEWGQIVCDVLTYLHTQEPPIIHRDIKPANLRLTPHGDLMVIDLGIAKEYRDGSATTRAAQAYSGGYSPIEQYLGQGTDPRSDLYALGATLYHCWLARCHPKHQTACAAFRCKPLSKLAPIFQCCWRGQSIARWRLSLIIAHRVLRLCIWSSNECLSKIKRSASANLR